MRNDLKVTMGGRSGRGGGGVDPAAVYIHVYMMYAVYIHVYMMYSNCDCIKMYNQIY